MTGQPLFLASGLLKMLQLVKGQRNFTQKAALAFLRPGDRIRRRVTNLLALADGRVSAGPLGRNAYLVAVFLVAVLGLQVGARIAADDSAYAIVLGRPESTRDSLWRPAMVKPLPQLPHVKKGNLPPKLRLSKLNRLLRSTELRANLTLKQKDVARYFKRLYNMAPLLGVQPAALQWNGRAQTWGQATPLLQQPSFSVYRLDAS